MSSPLRQTSDPDIMEKRGGGGCISIFGIPFLLAGLFVLQIPLGTIPVQIEGGPLVVAIIAPLGLIFAVVGAALVFGRNGTTIDRRRRLVTTWWGLLVPFRKTEHPLDFFEKVRMDYRAGNSDSADTYPISLTGRGTPQTLLIVQPAEYGEARRTAESLARFLGKPLEDTTAGTVVERDPEFLDENLIARIRRTRYATPPVLSPPPDMRTRVEESGEGLVLTIPPAARRGLRWIPVLGALVMAGIVLYAFVLPLLLLPGPPIIRYGMAAFATLFFVFGPVLSSLRWLLRGSRDLTRVTVSRSFLRVEEVRGGRTRTTEVPAEELEALELPTKAAALDTTDSSGGQRPSGAGDTGTLRLPDGRPFPPWLQFLARFYQAPGIIAQTDRLSVAFGKGLPDEELRYLHGVIIARLAG